MATLERIHAAVATRKGAPPIETVEARKVGRRGRFVITRYRNGDEWTPWTITHAKSGIAVMQVIPGAAPATLDYLAAVIRAWDRLELDPRLWALIDDLKFGQMPAKDGRAVDQMRMLGSALKDAALQVWRTYRPPSADAAVRKARLPRNL